MLDLENTAFNLEYHWKNPPLTAQARKLRIEPCRSRVLGESEFSRYHAALSGSSQCWICLFPIADRCGPDPLWKSWDHVIPRSRGGTSASENLRVAHRRCNAVRKSDEVTKELVRACRLWMVQKHLVWIGEQDYDKSSGLRCELYPDPSSASDHQRAFEHKSGAD